MLIKPVKDFMLACDQTVGIENKNQEALYAKLMQEELAELEDAVEKQNPEEILDACCDLVWVTIGFYLSKQTIVEENLFDIILEIQDNRKNYFLDDRLVELNKMFYNIRYFSEYDFIFDIILLAKYLDFDFVGAYNEVARSNMSKVDSISGKVLKREDGKVLKPETYSPPNLSPFI